MSDTPKPTCTCGHIQGWHRHDTGACLECGCIEYRKNGPSDTLETNAFAPGTSGDWPQSELQWSEFARKLERERDAMTRAYAGAMARHGQFCADVIYAAFGHRDALTHEQIIAGLRALRASAEAAGRLNDPATIALLRTPVRPLTLVGFGPALDALAQDHGGVGSVAKVGEWLVVTCGK